MKSEELNKIFLKYWEEKGWKPPSEEWSLKLTKLLQDSIILLKDAIFQSEPFFLQSKIQEDGEKFLKREDSKNALKHILKILEDEKIAKINLEIANEIFDKIIKEKNFKKGLLMRSLRVAFFGCLSGPDLIQSWELFSENNNDLKLIKRCFYSI